MPKIPRPAEVLMFLPFLEGDEIQVLNYRCRPAKWENGVIDRVKIGVDAKALYTVSYDIILDRRCVGKRTEGKCLWCYVGAGNVRSR